MRKREAESFADSLAYKCDGLVTAVAQDYATNRVLMVAFMNREAIAKTLTSGKVWYYSRSRKKLWRKGETSGCEQIVKGFSVDCDRDAVLFKVRQIGNACHEGSLSCFRGKESRFLTIDELYSVIEGRKLSGTDKSYTRKLLNDRKLLLKKINEEATELIMAAGGRRSEAVWESCDLIYHILVLLCSRGIGPGELYKEFRRRRCESTK